MSLLLDFGNSRCKFQIVGQKDIEEHGVWFYPETNKPAVIKPLLHDHRIKNKVIVCSVLDDQFNNQLVELLERFAVDYYFLDPEVRTFGIQLGYQNPGHLGADRLAALIAANNKFTGKKCIIDCGTAITIDALDANGAHLGGMIFPGFISMQQALSVNTDIKCGTPNGRFSVFSNTTQDAIYTGCLSSVAGGIAYAVNLMQTHSESFDHVIITGGNAEQIIPSLSLNVGHESKLVLDGLMIVLSEL